MITIPREPTKIFSSIRVKMLLFLSVACVFISAFRSDPGLDLVRIYMVKWDSRYLIVRSVDNIKDSYLYYFESEALDVVNMFSNYADCVAKLQSQDTTTFKYNSCNICTELCFGKRKVNLFFKNTCEYYFDGQWHKMNPTLYYALFSNFSDELVPASTLSLAEEKKNKNRSWK